MKQPSPLRLKRILAGLGLEEAAFRSGISRSRLSRVEREVDRLRADELARLEAVLADVTGAAGVSPPAPRPGWPENETV